MLKSTSARGEGKTSWRQLGKIRLGEIINGPKGTYPKDCDYFVIDYEKNPELKALGEKPKSIDIMLMGRTLEQCFDTDASIRQSNGARTCWTRDEVRAKRYLDVNWDRDKNQPKPGATQANFQWVDIPCPGEDCEFRQPRGNKPSECQAKGYFKFAIQGMEVGEYFLKTGSKIAQSDMFNALRDLEIAVIAKGRPAGLFGLRMKLYRKESSFFRPGKEPGVQARITKWTCMVDIDWLRLAQEDQLLLADTFEKNAPRLAAPAAPEAAAAEPAHEAEFKDVNEEELGA